MGGDQAIYEYKKGVMKGGGVGLLFSGLCPGQNIGSLFGFLKESTEGNPVEK